MKDELSIPSVALCEHDYKPSLTLVPRMGSLSGSPVHRGTTLNYLSGAFTEGQKCQKCGHTFVAQVPGFD